MSVSKTLFDITRIVPETDETGWGGQVTNQLVALLDGADAVLCQNSSTLNIYFRLQAASSTLAGAATLTPTKPVHKVQGDGGAVTLAGIGNGLKDGQLLILLGAHAANTVKVAYSASLLLNGNMTLGEGDMLLLMWDAGNSRWHELSRSI